MRTGIFLLSIIIVFLFVCTSSVRAEVVEVEIFKSTFISTVVKI